ncbi:MAG: acetate/propionate family kinase [Candidatus Berkelbacteria bacterium]|nr:acetate/propionate family kinase [Candidatus Berkelbacteria bacterium]
MSILVLNSGSSSLKFKLFNDKLKELKSEKIDRIGAGGPEDHKEALKIVIKRIGEEFKLIDAIGHRVVHGGDKYGEIELLKKETITGIEELSKFAPLHNPPALAIISSLKKYLRKNDLKIKQYACFDTAFFKEMPIEAKYYPLPYEYYQKKKIKKYGFHGISHKFAAQEAAKELMKSIEEINLITIHLGAGSSITAIEKGKPIETSMGFTPNEGLMMMTRSGGIDPSVVLFMLKEMNLSPDKIENILEKQSGLLGISGVSDDMKDILFVAGIKVEDPDYVMPANIKCDREHIKRSELAIEMFCRTVKKYIGGYMALLGGVDALVFTGEIGFGSSILRERIAKDSDIKILAIKPNEELKIARLIQENT